jgi:hypothetical protein
MLQKENIRQLMLSALVAVSLGGWILHLRIHSPFSNVINWIPFIAGVLSVVAVPGMFLLKRTRAYAYVINGFLVIIGTITMAHFSILHPPHTISIDAIIVGTLFADIAILFSNFFIGKALFELDMMKVIDGPARTGRFWRYPNMGWWEIHFVTLSFVYILGNILWK